MREREGGIGRNQKGEAGIHKGGNPICKERPGHIHDIEARSKGTNERTFISTH